MLIAQGDPVRDLTFHRAETHALFWLTLAAPVGSVDATRPIVMTDLRMGQRPWFVFSFVVAEHGANGIRAVPNRQIASERPPVTALPWLWHRIWDENATY